MAYVEYFTKDLGPSDPEADPPEQMTSYQTQRTVASQVDVNKSSTIETNAQTTRLICSTKEADIQNACGGDGFNWFYTCQDVTNKSEVFYDTGNDITQKWAKTSFSYDTIQAYRPIATRYITHLEGNEQIFSFTGSAGLNKASEAFETNAARSISLTNTYYEPTATIPPQTSTKFLWYQNAFRAYTRSYSFGSFYGVGIPDNLSDLTGDPPYVNVDIGDNSQYFTLNQKLIVTDFLNSWVKIGNDRLFIRTDYPRTFKTKDAFYRWGDISACSNQQTHVNFNSTTNLCVTYTSYVDGSVLSKYDTISVGFGSLPVGTSTRSTRIVSQRDFFLLQQYSETFGIFSFGDPIATDGINSFTTRVQYIPMENSKYDTTYIFNENEFHTLETYDMSGNFLGSSSFTTQNPTGPASNAYQTLSRNKFYVHKMEGAIEGYTTEYPLYFQVTNEFRVYNNLFTDGIYPYYTINNLPTYYQSYQTNCSTTGSSA
jgi:hypothetical protein